MPRWKHVEGTLRVDEAADAELISAVRGGDVDAYGELFGRHVDAARRLARQLVPPSDADDLVSEAFTKVLVVLQRGGGPDLAFRAYLLTAIRRLHVDRIRATSRVQTTDDLSALDPGVPFRDTAVEGFENAAAARAFASLPERWQMVLWHTEVEGQKPADIAPLLGMSANSVAALAYRAREGLRQAFLSMHVQELEEDACTWTHQNLGAYVRGGASRRDSARIEAHLEECRRCTAIYLELTEVNSSLAGIIAPLLLGAAATAYVASAVGLAGLSGAAGVAGAGAAGKGAVLVLLDRAKDLVLANLPATAAASVAAGAVVAGGVLVTVDRDEAPPSAREPVVQAPPSASPEPGGADRGERRAPDRSREPAGPATTAPAPAPSSAPSAPSGSATAPGGPGPTAPPPAPGTTDPGPPAPTTPPPPPDPPVDPAPDLAVSAEVSAAPGGIYTVRVSVSGFDDTGSATLTVDGEGIEATLSLDERCRGLSLDSGTCSADQTTTFEFTALAPLPTGASLVFTVTPDDAPADADPSDNRVTVPLG